MRRLLNKFSTGIFYFTILLFIIAFNFAHNPPGGWNQQFLPNLNGRIISDILFTDSLNGYATANAQVINTPSYVLKTTNGGDNWIIIDSLNSHLSQIQFLNENTGYVGGAKLFKTINKGNNWIQIPMPMDVGAQGFSALNEDTILCCFDENLTGGVFRTTNAGQDWNRFFYQFGQNPNKIYMFDKSIGFFTNGDNLRKTTNGGVNWFGLSGGPFTDIHFIDSLTGWKSRNGSFEKTFDGGNTWTISEMIPKGGIILVSGIGKFTNINRDTILGVGAVAFYGNGRFRGLIYKTTNSGLTWGYQQPDTSILIDEYKFIDFTNKLNGWAYHPYSGIHTVTGGDDTTYFVGIKQVPNYIPEKFTLGQNFPNPFNPTTSIPFELKESSYVTLKVYDIKGAIVKELVNGGWSASKYVSEFDGTDLSSGIYFYKLDISGDNTNEIFTMTKRMMLIK
jgi:photosystem II stability/assembly factor-like uncharacterized protein